MISRREEKGEMFLSISLKLILSFFLLFFGSYRLSSEQVQSKDDWSTFILKQHSNIFTYVLPEQQRLEFLHTYGHLCSDQSFPISRTNSIYEIYQSLEESSPTISEIKKDLLKFCMIAVKGKPYVDTNQVFLPSEVDGIPEILEGDSRNFLIQTNLHGGISKPLINTSFIHLGATKSGRKKSVAFLRYLMENLNEAIEVANYPTWKGEKLWQLVQSSIKENPSEWNILQSYCVGLHSEWISNHHRLMGLCSRSDETPCCEAKYNTGKSEDEIFFLKHGVEAIVLEADTKTESEVLVDSSRINSNVCAPRFFDILLENDCLPSYKCHSCLAKQEGGDMFSQCKSCSEPCSCYCATLCRLRPHTTKPSKILQVTIPTHRKEANRLIPRIIHQTYFEPLSNTKYPNFSRLVQSFKLSGWKYIFYNDEDASLFLSSHFPPEVKEAYDTLIPGAFKADLFRYCVLLIHGGIYADVDVLLSADLEKLFESDVGFMVPVDEPGRTLDTGSCLWNGFIASAPGHPFIARTIELVVNSIRNRFTAVDFDDMLCPKQENHPFPDLDLSHSFDLLYLSGPCILGSAINDVIGRHMQAHIPPGELQFDHSTSTFGKVSIQGRTLILGQNKTEMGAHRFSHPDRKIIVATTDMPDYDDIKKKQHYSASKKERTLFGLKGIYRNLSPANEYIELNINV